MIDLSGLNPCKCGSTALYSVENCQTLMIVGCEKCTAQATYGMWQAGMALRGEPKVPVRHRFDHRATGWLERIAYIIAAIGLVMVMLYAAMLLANLIGGFEG